MGRRSFHRAVLAPLLIAAAAALAAACHSESPAPVRPGAEKSPESVWKQARALLNRGESAAAEKMLAEARGRHAREDSEPVFALRVLHGEALLLTNGPAKAKQQLELPPPAALADSMTEVRRRVMLTYTTSDPAVLPEADAVASRHPHVHAEVLNAQAWLNRGNQDAAIAFSREALQSAAKNANEKAELSAMGNIALNSVAARNFVDAVQWGEQVLARTKARGYLPIADRVGGNLGWTYIELGDLETAHELLTEAEKLAGSLGSTISQVNWLNLLGNIHLIRGDYASADVSYRKALDVGTKTGHDTVGAILTNLARLSLETGKLDDARRLNQQALEWKLAKRKDESSLNHSRVVEARILAAERRFDQATTQLESIAAKTKDASIRWEAQGRLAEVYVASGNPARAEVEFRRALATVQKARQTVGDQELRLAFLSAFTDIFASYLDFLIARGRGADALLVTERYRAQTLAEDLEVDASSSPMDARAVARATNATILSYYLGPERSYLWTITADEVRLTALPPGQAIDEAVDRYQRQLRGLQGTLAASGKQGAALYDMLVKPAAIAPGSRVLVIPDGRLHALNFETLVTNGHYWIEDVILSNASSLQLITRHRATATGNALLLVGNAPQADPSFPPLRHAGEEVKRVARHFEAGSSALLDGPRATPAAFHGVKPERFDYVHFVAHGFATRKRPLDSAVILGKDGSGSYKLLARDVVRTPLAARLVTISSCHGAGTRAFAGEGLVGLAWAFVAAGADQVIAALWEVNDSLTPQLMDRMYERIAAGTEPAVALREAKLAMVRSSGRDSRAVYWAPFVHYF